MKNLSITKPSNSVRKYSDPIPVDLLIDIFLRVHAKSITRFRCVSKFWSTILVRQDFTELFLTKSLARPRFLFTFEFNGELVVFSSPQPQNPLKKKLSLVATRYKNFPRYIPTDISHLLCERGLVFHQNYEGNVRMIYNPATGESVTLPEVTSSGTNDCYLGYDLINKQYKVLCMTEISNTHRVLTLEEGKLLWRMIQDQVSPHFPTEYGKTCINGVLYYMAYFGGGSYKIVCFDFSSEKFGFINMDKDMLRREHWTLFNYKGKLGACLYTNWHRKELVLWVLEDAGKHKWSKRTCVPPHLWDNGCELKIVLGMTGTGEIVFSPYILSNPFHLFYYNIERNIITRVNIQGFEEFKHDDPILIRTFLDYVESVKFM